jgi:hypothetical protein
MKNDNILHFNLFFAYVLNCSTPYDWSDKRHFLKRQLNFEENADIL